MHTEPRALRRLLVVTSDFHLARTQVPSRTNWTRLVPPPVLIGHASYFQLARTQVPSRPGPPERAAPLIAAVAAGRAAQAIFEWVLSLPWPDALRPRGMCRAQTPCSPHCSEK
jgi:hypothetical protein